MNTKKIPIPESHFKRALFLVDIQRGFIKDWNKSFLLNVHKLFAQEAYDLYFEISFHAEKGSLWDKETHWTFPYEPTTPEVMELIKNKKVIHVVKETKSAFKGNKDVKKILDENGIKEVHIIGFDSSDCVFATAQEAFDLGYYTYVIEECTGASEGEKIHTDAIEILRNLGLTNHSEK